jgi:sialate O-acetylesterase
MSRFGRNAWALVAVLAGLASARAEVKLPRVFGSHMVLQRDVNLPVWGWADAGEEVTVSLTGAAPVKAKADAAGAWRVNLPPRAAGGPLTLTVQGKNTVVCEDVLVGEVWVCSGQSNMEWTVSGSLNPEEEAEKADYPTIRQIKIPKVPQPYPVTDVTADWVVCTPKTAPGFTACGYFMARELQRELQVPIGLINTSWGGTRIEPWTNPEGFAAVPELKGISDRVQASNPRNAAYKAKVGDFIGQMEAWIPKAREAMKTSQVVDQPPAYPPDVRPITADGAAHGQPTTLYNGMVAPLVPYAMRGAIWYQGESNHNEGKLYTAKMRALVGGWRQVWAQGEFPFLYVQIAPYSYGAEPPFVLPEFWEAQTDALKIPNTGMVVTTDIGNIADIHPKNKQEVGRRLALLALKGTYGKPTTVADGPVFKSMAIEGAKIRVRFDNVGGGLLARDGKPLNWFEIIGADAQVAQAEAVIDGDSVLVSSPNVPKPVAVRFAWHKHAEPNLRNKEGLPARPFRAGEIPKIDHLALNVPEARDFKLVYDLDLAKLSVEPKYDANNAAEIKKPIDRVAYCLELQKPGQDAQWVFVSMDPFTTDLTKIGVPTVASKAVFQQFVANVNVVSNVQGIVNGTGLKTCNIEFWPHNYGPLNAANVPGANATVYDFGDQYVEPVEGHGSLQVHNHGAKQTILALNNWRAGGGADIGIGNWDGRNPDWTFAGNAGSYFIKRLRVLVHEKP